MLDVRYPTGKILLWHFLYKKCSLFSHFAHEKNMEMRTHLYEIMQLGKRTMKLQFFIA